VTEQYRSLHHVCNNKISRFNKTTRTVPVLTVRVHFSI
jgi:hypothetical protein